MSRQNFVFPSTTFVLCDKVRTFQWSTAASARFRIRTGIDAAQLADAKNVKPGDGLRVFAVLIWCGMDEASRSEMTVDQVREVLTIDTMARIHAAIRTQSGGNFN